MNRLKNRLRVGGGAAAVVLGVSAILPALSLRWVQEARAERDRVQQQVDGLRRTEALVVDAETGQRGFVITGKAEFLEPYRRATRAIPEELAALHRQYASEPEPERHTIDAIDDNARRKLAELAETVALRESGGFPAVEPMVSAGSGKQFMDELRKLTDGLVARENAELTALEGELAEKIRWAIASWALGALFSLIVFSFLGRMLWQAIRRQERLSDAASLAKSRLEDNMETLRAHNAEVSALSEMARVLQTEMGLREALKVTAMFCARLMPGTHGVLYLFRNSADILENAAQWDAGAVDVAPVTIEPSACWGLRLGRPHHCGEPHQLRCSHYGDHAASRWQLCIPLLAYGEVLGLLEISGEQGGVATMTALTATAQSIAEQVALSLANTKLRQVLRDQSIKDPLTGLFNRRYMEETLARELARAGRQRTPLSVIVVDLDHFKRINDTYGHPAGDAVLRKTGHSLGSAVRGSDVACRFGGEEFILILPDCSKDAALAKAKDICERIRSLSFADGAAGVQVTASLGVASFPLDGSELHDVIQAADAALYSAKKAGRDRVVAAGRPASPASRKPALSGFAVLAED